MYGLSFESMSQSETYLWMYPSGLDRTSSTSPSAITLPPSRTTRRVHIARMTSRSWVISAIPIPVSFWRSARAVRMCAWTEASSIEVGSSRIM